MAGSFSGIELPDVNVLRQLARDELVMLLESMAGMKDLVLDAELMRPLDRIAGAILLKEHGVGKIFKLEPTKSLPGSEQRIYLVRPQMASMKYIADQINSDRNSGIRRAYKIVMVPRKLYICERVLENEGVFGYVDIEEFPLDLIPLDKDVLSLELPFFYKSVFLESDQTWLHTVARSLVGIQEVFGLIPNVYGFGSCAKKVYDMMNTFFELQGEPKQIHNDIGHLFIIDRNIDYVTPLCTQVTYQGLLDDIFGISSGFIEFGPDVTGRDQSTKLLLTLQDLVFEEIADRHFSNVFNFLSSKAKELQVGYDKRHGLKSVSQMKDFVAKDLKGLKQQHKSLSLHIGACEVIVNKKTKGEFVDQLRTEHSLLEGIDSKGCINYIEEAINRQLNKNLCLRFFSLLSLTQGGLSTQVYKSLKTQFVQSFGFEHLTTFHNLRKLGIITENEPTSQASKHLGKVVAAANIPKSSPFRSICKKLALIPKNSEDVNLRNPSDMSYVFSAAYTPMVCKLVEQILNRETFLGLDDIVRLLPGPTFENVRAKSMKGKAYGGGGANPQTKPSTRIVLVYFIGGCTYTEITALRFLGRLKGYKFIIGTTSILGSTSLVTSVS